MAIGYWSDRTALAASTSERRSRPDDGAFIYVQYPGVLEMNERVQAAMGAAEATEFSDQYFRTSPRFETGDERYAWLTQAVFVGEGRVYPGLAVEYRVFRLT